MLAYDDQIASTTSTIGDTNSPLVSELEQEVLDEYARLLDNVNKVCNAARYLHAFCLIMS